MVSEFLSWYLEQLRDLLPERLARRDPAGSNAILAAPHPGEPGSVMVPGAMMVWVRKAGQERQAGLQHPGTSVLRDVLAENPGVPLLLRLPREAVLNREVSLPLAAEAGYERVLQYEMDRLTPFAAADIFWSARILRRNKESGRLDLLLSLVPRGWLAASLATLQEAGGRLTAIEVAGTEGAGTELSGQSAQPAQRIAVAHEPGSERLRQRRLMLATGGIAIALAVIAIILPFLLQSVAGARVDRRIAALQTPMREVEADRERIRASTAGGDIIAADRAHLGDALGLIAAVTRVLPDDTYLTDLTLHDGTLTLTGQSPGAVKLIPALSADAAFTAPAFSAPVTRIESNNADLFSIRAGVAQPEQPPPPPQRQQH